MLSDQNPVRFINDLNLTELKGAVEYEPSANALASPRLGESERFLSSSSPRGPAARICNFDNNWSSYPVPSEPGTPIQALAITTRFRRHETDRSRHREKRRT